MKGKDLKTQAEKVILKDGNEYLIEFSLNGLIEIEDIFGDITEVYKVFDKFSLKSFRSLLYAGLVEHHQGITEREVGTLFDMTKMGEIMEVLTTAFMKAFPESEDEIEGKK